MSLWKYFFLSHLAIMGMKEHDDPILMLSVLWKQNLGS